MSRYFDSEIGDFDFYSVLSYPYFLLTQRERETPFVDDKDGNQYQTYFFTFDIESTTLNIGTKKNPNYQGFMYCWQVHDGERAVFGRTWKEAKLFFDTVANSRRNKDIPVVVYVQFLPYEFQFIRDYFNISEVFATDKRQVLRFMLDGAFEFRDSYKLFNMNLDSITRKAVKNCPYVKQSGEKFDYSIIRTPNTKLTDSEMAYCFCDVAGLHYAITYRLLEYGDNLATIPMTSTGYIRREARNAFRSNYNNVRLLRENELTPKVYELLRTARRGGNSHANPVYSNEIIENLKSKDMSSAYPAVMLQKKFPMSKWYRCDDVDFLRNYNKGEFAYLVDIDFINIKLSTMSTIPYIALAKAVAIKNPIGDNGRLLKADLYGCVLTDIDFEIIRNQYDYDEFIIHSVYKSEYEYLPDEYRKYIFDRYIQKCELKFGDEYLYNKEKNKINALFGMMLTDIVHKEVLYNSHAKEPFIFNKEIDFKTKLRNYYKNPNSFLNYDWGVWVTAHCRKRLQKAIDLLGDSVVYCDTDSAKYIQSENADKIFNELNKEIEDEISNCGFNTRYNFNNTIFELGKWESDGNYQLFKTMGAKKYCYVDENGKFSITVAGLSKSKGKKYLEKHGGINAFNEDFEVPPEHSGRTTSKFNDIVTPFTINVNGEKIEIRSNIAIHNVSYKFGLTKDYSDLLYDIKFNKAPIE